MLRQKIIFVSVPSWYQQFTHYDSLPPPAALKYGRVTQHINNMEGRSVKSYCIALDAQTKDNFCRFSPSVTNVFLFRLTPFIGQAPKTNKSPRKTTLPCNVRRKKINLLDLSQCRRKQCPLGFSTTAIKHKMQNDQEHIHRCIYRVAQQALKNLQYLQNQNRKVAEVYF